MQIVLPNNLLAEQKGTPSFTRFQFLCVHDKVRCHCFPQETFEKGFVALAMKSWALLHTLGSHCSTYRFLRSPTCHSSGTWHPAAPGDRGRFPRSMILTASGAVKRMLLRHCRSNSLGQADRKEAKEKDFSWKWIRKWPERHILLLRGLCLTREWDRLMRIPLVVKAANFSTAHQLLCCERLVTDTHAHPTSPSLGLDTPDGST